jgi:hypothetical protein
MSRKNRKFAKPLGFALLIFNNLQLALLLPVTSWQVSHGCYHSLFSTQILSQDAGAYYEQ